MSTCVVTALYTSHLAYQLVSRLPYSETPTVELAVYNLQSKNMGGLDPLSHLALVGGLDPLSYLAPGLALCQRAAPIQENEALVRPS